MSKPTTSHSPALRRLREPSARPVDERAARTWAAPLVLLVVALAVLWTVCAHEFVVWDDGNNVTGTRC